MVTMFKKVNAILILFIVIYSGGHLLEAEVLWQTDFNTASLLEWTIVDDIHGQKSDWHVYEGFLINTTNIGGKNRLGTHIVTGSADWRNYTMKSDIVSTDDDYIGILFRYRDDKNYYRFYISGQNGTLFLEKRTDGKIVTLASAKEPLELCKMTFYASVHEDTIRVYINNRKYFEVTDNSHKMGKIGLMTCYNEGAYFDNVTVSTFHDVPVESECPKLEFWCGPYLQNVLGDSATIMWQTNLPANSCVEYGLSVKTIKRIEFNEDNRVHEVCLRNLERGQSYLYRVISDSLISDWHSFKTMKADTEKFRFILYSDSQNNFIVHSKIASEIVKYQPDFIVSAGDLAHGGRRSDWATEFFLPMQEVLKNTPIYVSVGNHSYGSPHFSEYFSFPEHNHETYYSIQIGNAYFIFLDNAKIDFPDKDYYTDIGVGSPQYNWLEKELGSASAQNANWLFVVAHVPCYSEFSTVAFNENVKSFVPLYDRYNVDAVFSGHIHAYERGYSDGVYYIITGGAGGTLDHNRHKDIPEIQISQAGHHYCVVDISGRSLAFRQFSIDGVLRDSFYIDKDD